MSKAYWISIYQKINDPDKLAAYAALAGPAITAGGGKFMPPQNPFLPPQDPFMPPQDPFMPPQDSFMPPQDPFMPPQDPFMPPQHSPRPATPWD